MARKSWAKVHVKSLLYGATFVVGYISIAAVFNESMTLKTLDFLCSKCEVTRKIVDSTAESSAYSKINNVYTSCNNPAAFAGRNALKKASKCSYRQVDKFLNRSETYTNFKQTRNRFPRLKVQSLRLNEIWSVDLADMQNYLDTTMELLYFCRGRL